MGNGPLWGVLVLGVLGEDPRCMGREKQIVSLCMTGRWLPGAEVSPHLELYRTGTKGLEEQVLGAVEWACVLAWAPVTKHHRLGGLRIRHLFLTVLEAKDGQVPAGQVLGSPCLLAGRQPPSYCVFT